VHLDGVVVDARAQHRRDLLLPDHLLQHRPVQGDQGQPVRRVLDQLEPAVAVHGVGHVDQQRVRHRVPGEADQGVHDLLGVVAGGAGVPQPEGGEPVRVHVLG
jgi:hypothetical protein